MKVECSIIRIYDSIADTIIRNVINVLQEKHGTKNWSLTEYLSKDILFTTTWSRLLLENS